MAYYFHVKTKISVDFYICIRLNKITSELKYLFSERLFNGCFGMSHISLKTFFGKISYHIETRQLICFVDQMTSFFLIEFRLKIIFEETLVAANGIFKTNLIFASVNTSANVVRVFRIPHEKHAKCIMLIRVGSTNLEHLKCRRR